jgi:arylsulfatase A-like enzyme
LGLKTEPWSEQREPQQVPRHDRTRWMVDQTLAFAKQHAERPWLVNLWLDDVHTPYRPGKEQQRDEKDGTGSPEYRAVLRETDAQIGRLIRGLQELKLDSRTLVIVAGDNGPQPAFEQKRTNGLRGMKWSLYEGGIRTPLIIRWPGVIPANRVNERTVVSAVDVFPTLCALADVPPPAGVAFDGENLSAVWKGGDASRTRPLCWEYGRTLTSTSAKKARGFPFPNDPSAKSPNVAVRDGDWKLLVNDDGSRAELYNLAQDRNETTNVAAQNADVAQRLTTQALQWRKSLPE